MINVRNVNTIHVRDVHMIDITIKMFSRDILTALNIKIISNR